MSTSRIVDFGEQATLEMTTLAAAHGIRRPGPTDDDDARAVGLFNYWEQVIRLVKAFEPDRR